MYAVPSYLGMLRIPHSWDMLWPVGLVAVMTQAQAWNLLMRLGLFALSPLPSSWEEYTRATHRSKEDNELPGTVNTKKARGFSLEAPDNPVETRRTTQPIAVYFSQYSINLQTYFNPLSLSMTLYSIIVTIGNWNNMKYICICVYILYNIYACRCISMENFNYNISFPAIGHCYTVSWILKIFFNIFPRVLCV